MAPFKETEYRAKVILGWTTLHFAEETESWESIETLLSGGASTRDLSTTKRKLKNPLQAPSVVKEICRRGCLRLLRFALSENPDLVYTKLDMGRTLLHVAAQSGSSVAVRCLLDYPVDLNATDGRGVTPLHEAAAHCDAYILRQLLKQGANAEARDIDGRTALHYAASGGSVAGIQVLLEAGLSPDVESSNGCAPLHEAASSSNDHCVQMLLNAGADLHMTTNAGWTALHWAASKGTARSLRMLLEAGIQPGVRTQEAETPLHLAAERGDTDLVALLVDHGADVEALDSAGRTPAKRATDYLHKQQQEAAAAAAPATTPKEVGDTKQRKRHKEISQKSPLPEKTNTDLSSNRPPSEVAHEGDAQLHSDVEGSEYSVQSESEISAQVSSDTGSDFEEENYSPETASRGSPACACNKPPSLLSLDTKTVHYDDKVRGYGQRGKNRGRGRGYVRGQKSGSRGGGHGQSQEGKPGYVREYTQSPGKTQYTEDVQQGEHRQRQRRRHRKAKEGEAVAEYNTQSSSGDLRRNEHFMYTAGEGARLKHPFSKDRQKHPCDSRYVPQNFVPNPETRSDARYVPQNFVPNPATKTDPRYMPQNFVPNPATKTDPRYVPKNLVPNPATSNLQRREAYGSTEQINRGKADQINRQENRSGGTFLDELRYLQEKLAAVDAGTTNSQRPVPPPKPRPPPKPEQ